MDMSGNQNYYWDGAQMPDQGTNNYYPQNMPLQNFPQPPPNYNAPPPPLPPLSSQKVPNYGEPAQMNSQYAYQNYYATNNYPPYQQEPSHSSWNSYPNVNANNQSEYWKYSATPQYNLPRPSFEASAVCPYGGNAPRPCEENFNKSESVYKEKKNFPSPARYDRASSSRTYEHRSRYGDEDKDRHSRDRR